MTGGGQSAKYPLRLSFRLATNDTTKIRDTTKIMKRLTIIALSVACFGAGVAVAKETVPPNPFTETLSGVPAAELPAKAAQLVSDAKASAREATTINVVKAAVGMNPAAAPAVVGAIAQAVPDMAAIAAGVAASEQPKQAALIARAAAAAAPSKAAKIVTAVCRAVPSDYRAIANAVSEAVPAAGKEIVKAVGAALPNLNPYIEQAMTSYSGSVPTVAGVLDQATKSAASATTAPDIAAGTAPVMSPRSRGPTIGPPYISLSGTPTNVIPGNSGEVPPGGRNYAAP